MFLKGGTKMNELFSIGDFITNIVRMSRTMYDINPDTENRESISVIQNIMNDDRCLQIKFKKIKDGVYFVEVIKFYNQDKYLSISPEDYRITGDSFNIKYEYSDLLDGDLLSFIGSDVVSAINGYCDNYLQHLDKYKQQNAILNIYINQSYEYTDDIIKYRQDRAVNNLRNFLNDRIHNIYYNINILNKYHDKSSLNNDIELMKSADIMLFVDGWKKDDNCKKLLDDWRKNKPYKEKRKMIIIHSLIQYLGLEQLAKMISHMWYKGGTKNELYKI